MKRGLFKWVIVFGLFGAGNESVAGVFDPIESGILQSVLGYEFDRAAPGRGLPRADWFGDLMEDVLPDLVDYLLDDGKEQQDEQDNYQRDDEQAWREQQRAEQAEQEAEWQREEARRERERAEEAERREAEAREEAQRSRELAEEAQGTAQQARGTAEQARGAAQEAKDTAQQAKGVAQQARGAAQEARGISKQAIGTAEEAKGVAQEAIGTAAEAKGTADQAIGTAVETRMQVQQAHKRVGRQNTFVALLALLTLLALVLAMRKPRQAIVRAAGNAVEPLSRRFKPAGHRSAPATPPEEATGVVLTGFDRKGKPVSIPLPDAELDPKRGGFTLGRHHLLVDRVLDDERVSKRHARFTYRGHGYFVEDLNSTNGTVINGTQPCPPFRPMPIRPGDTVRVGGTDLILSA